MRAALTLAGLTRVVSDSDEIRLASIGDGLVLRSDAKALRGGGIVWLMSGLVLDLRGARLAPAGGELRIVTVMSGTVIRLPDSWDFSLEQTSIGSGSVPKWRNAVSDQTLRIKAVNILSGFRIIQAGDDGMTD